MSKIYFDEETDRRIEFERLMCNSHKMMDDKGNDVTFTFTENDFRHYIFRLGLLDYEDRIILPKQTGKPYKPYYFIQGEEVICRCEPVEEAV